MGTSWKEQEVSEAFNQYNDMLENILGYEVILDMVRNCLLYTSPSPRDRG